MKFDISTKRLYSFFDPLYVEELHVYVHRKIAYDFRFYVRARRMHVEKRNRGTTEKRMQFLQNTYTNPNLRIRVISGLYTCTIVRIQTELTPFR